MLYQFRLCGIVKIQNIYRIVGKYIYRILIKHYDRILIKHNDRIILNILAVISLCFSVQVSL